MTLNDGECDEMEIRGKRGKLEASGWQQRGEGGHEWECSFLITGAPRDSPPLTQRGEVMYGVSTLEDNRDKELQLIVGGILREISFIDFALTCGLTLHSRCAQWWVWLCALFAGGAILDWNKTKMDCKRSYLVRSYKKLGSESSARHLINAAVLYRI